MEFIIAILGICGLTLFMLAYSAFSWGLVTYKFYYWFLVALYPQAPAIDFKQAVMIMMIVSLFHNHSTTIIKKEYREDTAWLTFASPWFSLLMGYIIHSFL